MDLELLETGNGGDLVKTPRDLSVIFGFENMPYLSMFGGCVKSSTPVKRLPAEQAFDYWGNTFLVPELQFNSETERRLMEVALNSSGRVRIEEAIKKDLAFMTKFARVNVQTSIIATDKIIIGIRIIKLDNLGRQDFVYIWDATNQELIDREKYPGGGGSTPAVDGGIFDFSFGDEFD